MPKVSLDLQRRPFIVDNSPTGCGSGMALANSIDARRALIVVTNRSMMIQIEQNFIEYGGICPTVVTIHELANNGAMEGYDILVFWQVIQLFGLSDDEPFGFSIKGTNGVHPAINEQISYAKSLYIKL